MKRGELKIDLNCDMGEVPEAIADGTQEALMRSITSANIDCGGHAGGDYAGSGGGSRVKMKFVRRIAGK